MIGGSATMADPRPPSAVSRGAGLAGLAGLLAWLGLAVLWHLDGPYSALVDLAACAVPMIGWSLLVDKVHRYPSTGIDWHAPRPWRETLDTSLTKLAGYWATWAGIAAIYGTFRFYWSGNWVFAMACFSVAAPVMFVGSIAYVLWLDRRLVAPRDGAWAFGAWLTGQDGVERAALYNHLRIWAVKAFFLAFMLAGVPGNFGPFVRNAGTGLFADPVSLANALVGFMFVIDMVFATVGYILTFRPLDSHIRTANPYAAAWVAALLCYPPTSLMGGGSLFDYGVNGRDWAFWFQFHPVLLWSAGAALVVLAGIYASATVAFGPRFSNLTNRGILTHGPYAWSRHPAYLSKNLLWWLTSVPVLTMGSTTDAIRATVLMGVVSGIYYWRAKTEERHLSADPAYVAYSAWMQRNGAVPLVFAWLWGRRPRAAA
ncbi:isoprenylcysteine carboxylmethyltransferase family protein [Sphingomonas sp. GC_Shp_6]|uniref:methyltransferase family protein n=2 Tax=unclassified Sphingomonas TaxID=196159 RepID=UPI00226998F4|nr:isoprenylcysteine carboxylmethyltransferase family protein [Sphingomonas sp. GC_Shp_6]